MASTAIWRAVRSPVLVRIPRSTTCRPALITSRRCRHLSTQPQSTEPPYWAVRSPEARTVSQGEERIQLHRPGYFADRHIGPDDAETQDMLKALDPPVRDIEDFVNQTIPDNIRLARPLLLSDYLSSKDPKSDKTPEQVTPWGKAESSMLEQLQSVAQRNATGRAYIGCGYYGTLVPEVIKRNVLENPAWYTSYTPYQPEISQGRLESLLNYQTMITDLTGLTISNASVLDEGTAAAEAMTMSMNSLPVARQKRPAKKFVVSNVCHPQTIAVLESRAHGFGITIVVGDLLADDCKLVKEQGEDLVGVLAQYPDTTGGVFDFQHLADATHQAGALFSVATDLLALTVLKPPGEFGADIAFGSAQRFGVPLGFGGPHAAFFACGEKQKRKIPGRLVGVSKDRLGNKAMRLALQTREQHIRREKATSNICTAQALLANMSALYAIYHGPQGLRDIAEQVRTKARVAQQLISATGLSLVTKGTRDDGSVMFDTMVFEGSKDQIDRIYETANANTIYLRRLTPTQIGFSVDETTSVSDLSTLLEKVFDVPATKVTDAFQSAQSQDVSLPSSVGRTSDFLTHPVFNQHHSETEILRYIYYLQSKDLSLVHSMIPLGSCTMKLNATTEMVTVSMPGFANVHPFQPSESFIGYQALARTLEEDLESITGMHAVSLQPNSGAQGEFAGLRVIKKYLDNQQDGRQRTVCLIPASAHGTNPASAAMAGMKVVTLKCDAKTGNLDIEDLMAKCAKHKDELAAIMVTYPSTFGVFEPEIKRVCEIVHEHGGQVYMDGANLNAQIGLCSPGDIGADVCHLNLHKTFCIPHGGGGPGVGPIAVKKHLQLYLPSHPAYDPHAQPDDASYNAERETKAISPVSAAPYGSASILPISLSYIHMMGSLGLVHQTKIALLNANYIMSRLKPHYQIVYTNTNGRCAHEFILDIRPFKSIGIEAIDIAKRLQDYGFHAPTMSWPVANTLMIEPTESESKVELDRFCDALIEIRKEIKEVEDGTMPQEGNVLKLAPHPQQDLLRDEWDRPYSRQKAAYPVPWLKEKKFWPSVARVDDTYGDQNLFCTCSPVDGFEGLTGHEAPMPT